MVNRLERLERFFGGSRRREKDKGARNRNPSVASSASQSQNGPSFPSPSFMHPTSRHMKPREEPISWAKAAAKERSQSLPDPQGNPRRRSSLSSISAVLNHRHYPSDPIRPISFSIKQSEELLITQGLSQFRFPENSLKHGDIDTPSEDLSNKTSAHQYNNRELELENRLDWCPQRISSLFSNLGLETSIDDRLARFTEDHAEPSALLPSPILTTPPSPKTRIDSIVIPPRQSSRRSSEAPVPNLTNPSRSHSLSPFPAPPDSPPASDGEEERPETPINRPILTKALASPIELTPRPSFESNPRDNIDASPCRYLDRESWGTGLEDPALDSSTLEEGACISPSRLVRKSESVTSLSTIIRYVTIDRNLKEPTLDDFYALSDEDVLESLPSTPKLDTDLPPTPPPKDSPETPIGRSRSTRHAPIAPTATIDSSSGELTPPRTPINSQFLTLAYSPTNTSGTLGAMWAAKIANTYNFDLLYVISLQPKGEPSPSHLPRRSASRGRQREARGKNRATEPSTVVADIKSGMTGQLLAAYGLNEFGSPFRIHTQFHTNMLGSKGWKEYRDELASPGMISRGWTCSFYVPTAQNGISDEHMEEDGSVNQGIVFAAYTRKTTKSVIPVNSSPKQTAILGKLFYDTQTLVDALVHGN